MTNIKLNNKFTVDIKKNKKAIIGLVISTLVIILSIVLLPKFFKPPKYSNLKKNYLGKWDYTGQIGSIGMGTAFGKSKEGGEIKITRGDSELQFLIPIEKANLNKKDNRIIYTDEDKTIEARYEQIKNGLKESIILNARENLRGPPCTPSGTCGSARSSEIGELADINNSFMSRLNLKNLKLKVTEGGVPVFYSPDGEYQFHFQEPFAVDASGNRTNAVNYVIHPAKKATEEESLSTIKTLLVPQNPLNTINTNSYVIEVIVDKDWLSSPDRVYPITIDPTVVHDAQSDFSGQINRIKDVGIGETAPELVSYQQEIAPDIHTVGLWHMNEGSDNTCSGGEDVCDTSGNGNHGTFNNGASFTSAGKMGSYGVTMDGTDDYISIGDNSDFQFGTDPFTLEAWIKPNTLHDGMIFSKRDTNTGTGKPAITFKLDSTGYIAVSIRDNSGDSTTMMDDKIPISADNWYHVAFSRLNSNTWQIYVNGKEGKRFSVSKGNLSSSNLPLYIGIHHYGTTWNLAFDGIIDEAAVHNRALTPEEIKAHARRRPYAVYTSDVIDLTDVSSWNDLSWTEAGVNTGDGETPYDDTSLVAQWNFNETSGTSANNDAEGSSCGGTPSNCDGTLTNFSDTSGQDQVAGSGWTADNGRWPRSSPAGLMFDGSNDYVNAGEGGGALDLGTDPFTISMWVKSNSTSNLAYISKRDVCSVDNFFDMRGTETVSLTLHDGTTSNLVTSSTIITDGNWHFITAGRDANNLFIYIDGKLENTSTSNNLNINNNASLGIATSPCDTTGFENATDDGTLPFNGTIDSVRIYSRALTADEILANYQSGQIELQTRVGSDTSPDDGSWNDWSPTTSETQLLSMDSDYSNWTPDCSECSTGSSCATGHTDNGDGTCSVTLQMDPDGDDTYISQYYPDGNYGDDATIMTGVYGFSGEDVWSLIKWDLSNINIPVGSTINSATYEQYVYDTYLTGSLSIGVYPCTSSWSESSVTWNSGRPSIGSLVSNSSITYSLDDTGWFSHTVTDLVEDWINENQTNYGMAIKDTTGSSTRLRIKSYSGDYTTDTSKREKLVITYTPASTCPDQCSETKTSDSSYGVEGSGSMKITQGAPQVDANTVALWHLDETNGDLTGDDVFDSSGNGNHGEFNGTDVASGVVDGIFGKAREFNGSDDYISINSPSLPTGNFTYSAWVNTNLLNSNNRGIMMASDGNGANELLIYIESADNNFRVLLNNSAVIDSNTALKTNTWYHLTVTRSDSSVKLYINGEEDTTGSNSDTLNFSTCPLLIGTDNDSSGCTDSLGDYWDGTIDEVRISDTARTAEEIAEAYRAGRDHRLSRTITSTDLSSATRLPFWIASDRAGTYLETTMGESAYANYQADANTVGLWHLEEDSGYCDSGESGCVKDSSGNGNDGTPSSAPYTVQGKIGKGWEFDGSDDYIEITKNNTDYTVITLSGWIKTNDNSSNQTYFGFTGPDAGNDVEFFYSKPAAYDGITYHLRDNDNDFDRVSTGITLNNNQWYYISTALDFSNSTSKTYVNGSLRSTDSISGTLDELDTSTFWIGVDDDSGQGEGTNWNGTIDEVRISDTARSATEIRQAYEIGRRTHPITIDFSSAPNATDIKGDSESAAKSDTSFVIADDGMIENVFEGDKIIVRENYGGTEYIVQSTVSGIDTGTRTITVGSDWTGTVPNPGTGVCGGSDTHCFTSNATVFKWQREYWDLTGTLDSDLNAATNLTVRVTDASEGRTFWLDDFKEGGSYMTDSSGSTISSSTGNQYFQYRAVFSSWDEAVSPSLSSVTLDYESCTAQGETCSLDGDCCSGNCVDGYCCDTACDTVCEACDVSGSEGTCTYIAEDTDPDNDCDSACVTSCEDKTGDCDGAGACKTTYCSAGTACSAGTCGAGNYCNETWAYCSAPGDNNYDDGGTTYSCQGQCDGSNNCDYAANCSATEFSCYCNLDESNDNDQIIINWTDNFSSESGYEIERNLDGSGFSGLTTKGSDTTTHTDSDISSNHTYQYRIRPNYSDGSFGNWCTTDTLNLGVGNFNFEGTNFEGLNLN